MRDIVVLGSTGSIGKNTLAIARHLGHEKIKVKGLSAKSNIELLAAQIKEFSPEAVAVYDYNAAKELQSQFPKLNVLFGIEGICSLASMSGNPLVVSAMTGSLGLLPTIQAIKAGNPVAIANKEVLVAGGELVTRFAKEMNVPLLPIDSEHSALFQCLHGIPRHHVKKLILTASGGPFLHFSAEQLKNVSPEQALKHPNWNMGIKNTIDSSTLMNKGLEVIEARWLFNFPVENIEVVIHPQSVVHSFVEMNDSSLVAQMATPDMKIPIQYALTYPDRCPTPVKPIDFRQSFHWEFQPPDLSKFKCLRLAYDALKTGGSAPCFLNAVNEVLVQRFYNREISWLEIGDMTEELLINHNISFPKTIEEILEIEKEACTLARTFAFEQGLVF